MRLPPMRRVFRIAVVILLLEIVHKLTTLQRLMELQDSSNHLDHLMDWSPHRDNNKKHVLRTDTGQTLLSPKILSVEQAGNEDPKRLGAVSESDVCRIPPSEGPEGSMGFQALTKIQITNHQSSLRLLCIVVTDATHLETTLSAILETYASDCDGFFAASNQTDASRRHQVVEISGTNEWERLQRIWKYVQNYKDENGPFDAFHFGIESTYVIPSNLRRMLSTYSQFTDEQNPMYLGGAVVASRKAPEIRHCGGRAGYTLNRAALQLADRLSECTLPDDPKPIDQQLAYCLRQLADLQCVKTADQDSALRYIEFGLDYQGKFSTNTKKYVKRTPLKVKPLADYHGIYIRDGLQGIASDAVAFSVVDFRGNNSSDLVGFTIADSIRRVDAILKRTCKSQWDDPPIVALDVGGIPGYIHDATFLRRHPPPMTAFTNRDEYGVCDLPWGRGREGRAGYQGLQKIKIMATAKPKLRVLCMIYTHSNRHSTHLRAIAETYGPHCDGFLAASNKTDPSIGAVNLLHEGSEACKCNRYNEHRVVTPVHLLTLFGSFLLHQQTRICGSKCAPCGSMSTNTT